MTLYRANSGYSEDNNEEVLRAVPNLKREGEGKGRREVKRRSVINLFCDSWYIQMVCYYLLHS